MDQSDHARLGILMLDTRFPRIPGDVGNATTWRFPVKYQSIPGATPEAIVLDDPMAFVPKFVAAGRKLISEGCTGIATTCGFLSPMRADLARLLRVPVASSALEQAQQIVASLPPNRKLGILTISAASLTDVHLRAAKVPDDVVIEGMEGTSFAQTILENRETLDVLRAQSEMIAAADRLVSRAPEIGAILLECTNMPPYAAAIEETTGRPVYSIYSYLNWFHESLTPAPFDISPVATSHHRT